ncbi:hypothetical protein CVT26_008106 [Gymnopilus dilepis]|uniref:Uncharacterized protein n=1 Tax=Gymnopilus dilepis TaxID=231916 RepID=A0A409WWL5_9AGAR|nr:hypothetical protein CVT26_008106 [Gymnopilus dilepis]
MASVRKRKNVDGFEQDSNTVTNKRNRTHSGYHETPSTQEDRSAGAPDRREARRTTRHSQKKTPARVPSTPPQPDNDAYSRPPEPEAPAWGRGKAFYTYCFQGSVYPSLKAPIRGMRGPVEHFVTVSYPGEDTRAYPLEDGYVVPPSVVHEHDLYSIAYRLLEEQEALFPPCGQPPRARSPLPETPEREANNLKVWPPQRQGKPYVLVPANPYIIKLPRTSGKGKDVEYYDGSETEEGSGDDDRDEDFVPEDDYRNKAYNGDITISDFSPEGPSDPIEDAGQAEGDVHGDDVISLDDRESSQTSAMDEDGQGIQAQLSPMDLTVEFEEPGIQAVKSFSEKMAKGEELLPEGRVEASRVLMQVMANLISKADNTVRLFGGVEYIERRKTDNPAHNATFSSRNAFVLNEHGTEPAHKVDNPEGRKAGSKPVVELPASDSKEEPPHVVNFKRSDGRKRGRNYLGFTYNKVDKRRSSVDWMNFMSNSIKLQFRLENCQLSPHPGEQGFVAEKVPPKQWQDIGALLVADDFHPENGGCNPRATRFVSWTEVEKKYKKGSREYDNIPIIVNTKGEPLLRLHQAEVLAMRTKNGGAGMKSLDADDGGVPNEVSQVEASQVVPRKGFSNQSKTVTGAVAFAAHREAPESAAKTADVAPHAATPHPTARKTAQLPTGANPYPSRAPAQPETAQSKRKDDKGMTNPGLPLPKPALNPGAAAATAVFTRDLPYRGELGSGQHRKMVYTHPSQQPPVASATRAFYARSNAPPPSDRGTGHSRPHQKPRDLQLDSSRDPGPSHHPGTSKRPRG